MRDYNAKYNLSQDENVFVARRNIVDYIWKSAKLEGLEITFPETDAVYNGLTVASLRASDIVTINNLKHAWQFIFDTLDCPTDFVYICKLNRIVGDGGLIYNAGFLRQIPVGIDDTSWKSVIPIEADIKTDINRIKEVENPTLRAIKIMLYCMHTQMFVGGNKRTAMLAANHEMVANGCGIISIPIEFQPEFMKLLVEFYESGETETIQDFIYDNCIDGLDLPAQRNGPQITGCFHYGRN